MVGGAQTMVAQTVVLYETEAYTYPPINIYSI